MIAAPSVDQALTRRLRTFAWSTFGGAGVAAALALLGAALLRQPSLLGAAGVAGAVGLAALGALALADRGEQQAAAAALGCALLVAVPLLAGQVPCLFAALAVAALLPVALVLPHLEGRALLALFGLALADELLVAWAGAGGGEALPEGAARLAASLGLGAAGVLVLLLLWQFSSHLRLALERERAARAEAEAANRAKDEFLATVSHELRTPLASMLGWAGLLKRGKLAPERAAHAIGVIERSAQAQSRLIEDILDVSRIITGKLRLDLRPTHLGEVIRGSMEALRPAAEAKALELHLELPARGPALNADPARLQQVVWNLVSNAIKFTGPGGQVSVRCAQADGRVELSVKDTGMGIAAEFMPHVFERFRQADGRTTRQQGGLGLGLAIVRHLVELHGGTVRVESGGPGRGSTFTVELPTYRAATPEESVMRGTLPPASLAGGPMAALQGLRVLVVEDDPDTREAVGSGLAQYGATVSTAGSVAEALATVERRPPDVIVSDLAMPSEDGFALVRRLRELGWEIPVAALTGMAEEGDRKAVLSAGFLAHVAKPSDPGELAVIVSRLARQAVRPEAARR